MKYMNRAAIPIPEKLFFKIGEVCDITGIQAHVLRYWESEFPTLAPQKNRAGQRTYRKRDVEMVLRIKELLYEDQYTIAGAKKKLSSDIRGASKLKVVTPEMAAEAQANALSATHVEADSFDDVLEEDGEDEMPVARAQATFESSAPVMESRPPMTEERHEAVSRLRSQMQELLSILEPRDIHSSNRRK